VWWQTAAEESGEFGRRGVYAAAFAVFFVFLFFSFSRCWW